MDVGDTGTFCCISYLNVSTHLKFVLVSSWWRLSYRYHIDHLEHSGKNVGTGRKLAAAQHVNWHFWQYIVAATRCPAGANRCKFSCNPRCCSGPGRILYQMWRNILDDVTRHQTAEYFRRTLNRIFYRLRRRPCATNANSLMWRMKTWK